MLFFHKKKEEIEKPVVPKRVYDFETDKRVKVDLSSMYDASTGNTQANEKKTSSSTMEFVVDLNNGIVSETEEVEEETNSEEITDFTEFEDNPRSISKIVKICTVSLVIVFGIFCIWGLNSKAFLVRGVSNKSNLVKNTISVSGDGENIILVNEEDNRKSEINIEIDKISKDYIGNNIFLTNTGELKSRIEKLPYVSNAKVSRCLPDSLEVEYTFRKPYLSFMGGSGDYFIIDQHAYVTEIRKDRGYNIPVVTGIDYNKYSIGSTLDGTDLVKFKNINYLFQTAETIEFNYSISNIDYEKSDNVSFNVDEASIYVVYGEMNKNIMSDKLMYLKEIIKKSIENGYKGKLDISAEDYLSKSVLNSEI